MTAFSCWAAGIRTQNDRTKICCVTITPQLKHSLESECKDKQKIAKTNPGCKNGRDKTGRSAGFSIYWES